MALSRMDSVPCMTPQFTMRLRDRRVQVGFPVRLTCQIVGVPKPDIIWFKDGMAMAEDGQYLIHLLISGCEKTVVGSKTKKGRYF